MSLSKIAHIQAGSQLHFTPQGRQLSANGLEKGRFARAVLANERGALQSVQL